MFNTHIVQHPLTSTCDKYCKNVKVVFYKRASRIYALITTSNDRKLEDFIANVARLHIFGIYVFCVFLHDTIICMAV